MRPDQSPEPVVVAGELRVVDRRVQSPASSRARLAAACTECHSDDDRARNSEVRNVASRGCMLKRCPLGSFSISRRLVAESSRRLFRASADR